MESIACKNCGVLMQSKFCSECGQKRQTRISLKQISLDIYNALFDFESPFIKTIVHLSTNPGKVYCDYIDGARKRYFSPVKYSIWLLTLMVAIAAFTNTTLVDLSPWHAEYSGQVPSQEDFSRFVNRFQSALNALIIPLYFISSVILAASIRLFFRRKGVTTAELLMPALLSQGHFSLLISLTIVLGIYQVLWVQIATPILSIAYTVWGIAKIYAPTVKMTYIKVCLAVLVSYIAVMALLQLTTFVAGFATALMG